MAEAIADAAMPGPAAITWSGSGTRSMTSRTRRGSYATTWSAASAPSGRPVSPTTSCCDRASCRRPLELAGRLPDVRFVIDHLAKPPIASGALEPWRTPDRRRSRELEHVACKVSGLVTEADWSSWTPADLQPFVDHAIDVFGPERLDVRVRLAGLPAGCDLRAASSRRRGHALGGLAEAEQAAVMGANATRIYGL